MDCGSKQIAHGRAFGDGAFFFVTHPVLGFIVGDSVYFAKDGSTSMGGYAQGTSNVWRHSQIAPGAVSP